ncbi:unnamed protein product [Parnassius mnemosyne]|uniref:Retinol dehydrogenase 13 n=1 Tax=Parnassius mnemosyne TaxID=213953 RepID=A0AAV1LZD6_9NEOP
MFFWMLLLFTVLVIFIVKIHQQVTYGICRSNAHMVGKVVIITGGSSGIGLETAKNLADRGAKIIIACRSVRRAALAKEEIIKYTGNTSIHCMQLDLSSLRSVREFCKNILKTEKRLDVLINNAAAGGLGNGKTEDGLHKGMQVNYFGPFLLTCLLLPLLKSSAPSRIINVSSDMHKYGEMDFENLNMEKYWSDHLVYANSKLFLNLMTLELSRRLRGTNIIVNALHPGVTGTNLYRNIKNSTVQNLVKKMVNFFNKDPWEASQTSVYLAVSPEVANLSGRYFRDCREKQPSQLSLDLELAKRLWTESERLVDFTLPIY